MVPNINLNNGVQIPQLGFGVFQIKPEDTVQATLSALEVGYRHIDTAQMYGNEKEVGQAVRESGLAREDVFVTSKLNNNKHDRGDALKAFDQTLADLGFDYLDLFLIHWPLPAVGNFVDTWRTMEEIYQSGRVKAIGVSNFHGQHLRRVLGDPVITRIAQQVDRTPAQVVLRWHVQRGDIVFPKSVTRSRVEENFDIFDFELSDGDVTAITNLNRDQRTGPDPDVFNWVP